MIYKNPGDYLDSINNLIDNLEMESQEQAESFEIYIDEHPLPDVEEMIQDIQDRAKEADLTLDIVNNSNNDYIQVIIDYFE